MNKEKLIKWLDSSCIELDGLALSSNDDDSKFYTGQLVMAQKLLNYLENGFFDASESEGKQLCLN